MKENKNYTFLTSCFSECNSIANINLLNDFNINYPIDFHGYNDVTKKEFYQYKKLLGLLEINDPEEKLSEEIYLKIKQRIVNDFNRLSNFLKSIEIEIDKTVFISIGNSMESYGFMLKNVFPDLKIEHIKASRTLKDNILKHVKSEAKKDEIFIEYFDQRTSELVEKYENIKNVIYIDTFGAGETMSTMFYPFIKNGLNKFPEITIFSACLL